MGDYRKDMGKRIREKRKALGYTQEQLADRLEISIKHLGGVERGIAGLSMEHLLELCDMLGTDLNHIVCGAEVNGGKNVPAQWDNLYLRCPQKKRSYIVSLVDLIIKAIEA